MRRQKEEENRGSLVTCPDTPGASCIPPADKSQQEQDFTAETGRILESETMRHSEILRKLFLYLAEKSRTREADGLKEYSIGVEAFGKPAHYDPQEDPSVRVLTSKLRRKLEEYYLKEGASSRYRIEIPRGHFALKLRAAAVDPALQLQALRSKVHRWRFVAGILAVGITFSIIGSLRWNLPGRVQASAPAEQHGWTQELDLIWSPFLNSSRPVLVALGTPLFTRFSSGFFRNPGINKEAEGTRSEEIRRLQEQLGSSFAVPSYAYTGAGEAIGAFWLAAFLQGRAGKFTVERSSAITWDNLRHQNVIFVGREKPNLELEEIPADGGFVVRDGAVRNPQPRAGEPDAYRSTWAQNQTELLEDYALISRSPGLHGSGEIMALEGGSTEATWAAVEYATHPVYASELVRRVGLSEGNQLPRRYQVVLHVRFQRQAPAEIAYVTHRVLEQAPASGRPQLVTLGKEAR